ncbi:MAG: CRISPR-associated helicase Cas3' [Candidatus Omnitrophica bacterium]|jgi:CRISPR-associated endonuclease/helicase Cas3|nr:CRISPR-associated helicase Cas3' [Candidatus Omnitrophota bacterium]
MDKDIFIAHRRENDGVVHELWDHLEEVARKTGEFASKIGLQKQGELIGYLHDVGKLSDEFQRYIKSAVGLIDEDDDDYVDAVGKKGKIDHSSAGAQLLERLLNTDQKNDIFVKEILSNCLVSHHSGMIDCIAPDGTDILSKRMAKSNAKTHITEVITKIPGSLNERLNGLVSLDEMVNVFVDRLKALREKENDSKETLSFKWGLLTRFLYSCLIDADRLSTADFKCPSIKKIRKNGKYVSWDILIDRLNDKLSSFKADSDIDKLRAELSAQCFDFADTNKGLYLLTVPTGGGKTLASLRFSLQHAKKRSMDRIIYILPYTSIIDQNADEVRAILEKSGDRGHVVLEHHSNLTPKEESIRQKILAEDWDAPVVFTTMVQVLEALFGSGTQSVRRMHQMANAVIIFDEIQALPIKCVYMFNLAVRFLVNNCDSTVVLCTATQPLLDKVERKSCSLTILDGQQIVPDTKKLFKALKRFEVYDQHKPGGWSTKEIKTLIDEELKASGSVLVIVNTKKTAREIYQQCHDGMSAVVYHLSTYMCPAHRIAKFKEMRRLLDKEQSVVCVSTQLIEAGVDVDFGSVIRSLAGLDSIAQAAGRCNRHKKRVTGRVTIINPENENINSLKDILIGRQKAERVLDEYKKNPDSFDGDVLGLKAMERYYQYYFYERANDMNYPTNSKSAVGRIDDLFSLLSTNDLSVGEYERINKKSPSLPLRQAFMSAARAFQPIDSPARGIVVPYGKEGQGIINALCAAYDIEKQYHLLKEAQRYSVNIFENDWRKLSQAIHEVQAGAGVFYLDERYYSDDYGISEEPVSDMRLLND